MGKQAEPVSVVIPTWNAAAFVERVLERLVAQEGARFEVVVVDNGVVNRETELVVERFRVQFPALHYLSFTRQLGYAGAVNAGAKAAAYDLVAVLNNDNLPSPSWLRELLATYQEARSEGREAIVSSLVHRPDFLEPLGARMNVWGRIVRMPSVEPYVPFHPDGSAFLFSRAAFGQPYDEDYFIYHEDVALGWRAWLEGREVRLSKESRAETFDGGSTRRIAYRTAFYTERNRWLNYCVFLSWSTFLRLLPVLCLEALLKLAVTGNRRAKGNAWIWILGHPREILSKRRAMQGRRQRSDREILPLLAGKFVNGNSLGAVLVNFCFRAYFMVLRLPLRF